MKKLIRKWLGIVDVDQDYIKNIIYDHVNISQVEQRICDSVSAALTWRDLRTIETFVRSETKKLVQETIGTEKFIDDVVARIKNKQI
jgi:hypothetical protein